MAKPTQETFNKAVADLHAVGRPATYDSVREQLCCRKIDLVPYMQSVLSDARRNRARDGGGVARALGDLRRAVAEDLRAFWNSSSAKRSRS